MKDFAFSIFPNENFMDLRLYQYGYEQCVPLYSFGPFIRNHFLFHYVISGRGSLDSSAPDGAQHHYELDAGQGFLICPGLVNTYSADKKQPWKYVWLEFDGLRAAEFLEYAGLSAAQPIYLPNGTGEDSTVQDTMIYIADHSDASPLHLIGMLYLFLDALIRTSAARRRMRGSRLKDFYIQEAVTYMEHNYQRNLTVEEISDACGLNRSYFSKLFKDSMGCPPQEFLIRLRLGKATEMLRAGSMPIGEIAVKCGYPNQLHFSRAFKKRFGIPPREWRQQKSG
ncbi:MAG: AraC family transcriptional regulator [Butyricicoccus sp.]|nr:AraC family transcriptional regulator [Butyricicoccus sp.]